MNDIVKNLKLK